MATVIDFMPRDGEHGGAARSTRATELTVRQGPSGRSSRFEAEAWLTPMQIARKFGYATAKSIVAAIKSGELKAIPSPCRRKLMVATSEFFRWVDVELVYVPSVAVEESANARKLASRSVRRRPTPTLRYDATKPRSTTQ